MPISDIVANLAVFTTILQFLSGSLVCKKYVTNKTTSDASPLPFLCGLLSGGLWLMYGQIKHDNNIVIVNSVGVILMTVYIFVFYLYTINKSTLMKQFYAVVGILLLVTVYINKEEDNEVLVNRLGLSACILTIVTIAAPMSKLIHVIKAKNTDCLPFPMILMSFFVSVLWWLYALADNNMYIMTPNLIGGCLALVQLSLFVIYPSKPKSVTLVKNLVA